MSYKTFNISNYPKLQLSQIGKKVDGFLFLCGYNSSFGALGLGDLTNRSILSGANFSVSTTWKKLSGGITYSMGIQSNGTLWAIGGQSIYGQLGLSDTNTRSTPTQVGLLNTWTQLSSGWYSNLALQSNGTLWAWGRNDSGQLGLGDRTDRSSPTQVGTESYWTQISNASSSSYAIQSNGTLWSWGNGYASALGTNTSSNSSSPNQIGSSSTWSKLFPIGDGGSFGFALQSNGTLWAWGDNAIGQLGINTSTANILTPVQIGTASNWAQISAGTSFTMGIQSNGTLWAIGGNNFTGSLGLSDTSHRSSPVQVGIESYWTQIVCGNAHTIALQSNGTLWSWGQNNLGQLGLSDLTNRSSPVQVGLLNNWIQISASYTGTFVLQSKYF